MKLEFYLCLCEDVPSYFHPPGLCLTSGPLEESSPFWICGDNEVLLNSSYLRSRSINSAWVVRVRLCTSHLQCLEVHLQCLLGQVTGVPPSKLLPFSSEHHHATSGLIQEAGGGGNCAVQKYPESLTGVPPAPSRPMCSQLETHLLTVCCLKRSLLGFGACCKGHSFLESGTWIEGSTYLGRRKAWVFLK